MFYIDTVIHTYIVGIRTPFLTQFFYTLSVFFDISVASVIVVLCISYLIYEIRGKKYAVLFLSTISLSAIFVYIIKIIFNIARPSDALIPAFGQSFPSYHATVATVFFGTMIFVFDKSFKKFPRIIFNTVCFSGIILVSFSRVYLGVHWFSDVSFGIILGVMILYFSKLLFKKIWQ